MTVGYVNRLKVGARKALRVLLGAGFTPAGALVIVVFALTAPLWAGGDVALHRDYWFPLTGESYLANLYPSWDPLGSFPTFQSFMRLPWALLILLPVSGAELAGAAASRLALPAVFLVAALAMFAFARDVLPKALPHGRHPVSRWAAVLASLFYAFNPWTFNRMEHYYVLVGYALAPAVLLLISKALTTRHPRWILATAGVWTVASTSPFASLSLFLLVVGWVALHVLRSRNLRAPVVPFLGTFFGVLGLHLLFSAFWILPIASSLAAGTGFGPSYLVTVESLELLARGASPGAVAVLAGYWWPAAPYAWPGWEVVWGVAAVVPPALSLVVLRSRRNYITGFFALIAVLGLILSLGANPWNPLRPAYVWFVLDAPLAQSFGWLFREPERWSGLLAFAYSFFVGAGVIVLRELRVRIPFARRDTIGPTKPQRIAPIVAMVLVVAYAAPSGGYHIAGLFTPVPIPEGFDGVTTYLRGNTGLPPSKSVWMPLYREASPKWAPDRLVSEIDVLSSPIPSWSSQTLAGEALYTLLIEDGLRENRTNRAGSVGSVANLGYFVVHDDLPTMTADAFHLDFQEDLDRTFGDGLYAVYASRDPGSHIAVHDGFAVLLGGQDGLLGLPILTNESVSETAVLVGDQLRGWPAPDVVVARKVAWTLDYALGRGILDGIVVRPMESTAFHNPGERWSVATTLDPLHGPWHPYLEERGLRNGELDFGDGLGFTWAPGARLDLGPLPGGTHNVYIRHLQSPVGGNLSLEVGSRSLAVSTRAPTTEMTWTSFPSVSVQAGESLALVNADGFNAVNLVLLSPNGSTDVEAGVRAEMQARAFVLFLEAERLFSGEIVQTDLSGFFSDGIGIVPEPARNMTASIEVPWPGTYRWGVRASPGANPSLSVNGSVVALASGDNDWHESGLESLTAGPLTVTVSLAGGALDALYLATDAGARPWRESFRTRLPAASLEILKEDATGATVRLETSGRIIVTWAEAYDRLWRFRGPSGVADPIPLYLGTTGFVLDDAVQGNQVSIEYAVQHALDDGLRISAATFVACLLAVLLFPALGRRVPWLSRLRSKRPRQPT